MLDNLLKQIAEIKKIEITADEVKSISDTMQTKANEVEHTTNTGYGKELVPVNVLNDTVLAMVPTYWTFINAFNVGFHGNNMWASVKVPVKWEINYARGVWEWTTWAGALSQGTNLLSTGEVTITQYQIQASVDISRKLMNHSVADVINLVTEDMAKQFVRTMESAVLNADSNTSSGGNINSDDQLAATTFATTWGADDHRLLGYTGLRKTALDWTANLDNTDVWTLSMEELFTVRGQMGLYSIALNDLVMIMDYVCYNKALTLSEFLERQKNGKASTAITGAISNIAGVDLFVSREFPKTEADGKMSGTTLANNTKWGFLYVYRPAVQRGYGQSLEIDVVKIPWKWYQVIWTMEFWFAIANKLAWVTSPAVVLGYNIS